MNPDLLLPIITSLAWLILAGGALASYRLEWSKMLKLALVWAAIFAGIFLIIEWFFFAQGAAGAIL